ncbi:hypothetical protein ACQKWADRAFT_328854 [Trichoderma austrokoningii]
MASNTRQKIVSHLSVLYESASQFASDTAFLIPYEGSGDQNEDSSWDKVTYTQFLNDVERYALLWRRVLLEREILAGSIVGIPGFTYLDLLHIYGISRAGYTPQLVSIRLPNPVVVFELLSKTNASALIYYHSFASSISKCLVPHFSVDSLPHGLSNEGLGSLPPLRSPSPNSVMFIFHTSGSTSGTPKIVPCTGKWVDSMVRKAAVVAAPRAASGRDVTVWMGSLCHIAQSFMIIGFLRHGSCTIQPSQIAFSSDELQNMVHRCGLNRLNQFSTFLSSHFRNARDNPKLFADLQMLDSILYSGLPMAQEDEDWAYRNGLKLSNIFGSTEVGGMMLSIDGAGSDATLLRPLPGTNYVFEQITEEDNGRQFLELIILPDSPDCPVETFRQIDGKFRTGDLFTEIKPGRYKFCGRNDDWIKSENSLRCDTRAIEENVLQTCRDLIDSCIVVGTGRPSPALFVETASDINHEHLKQVILDRIQPFHSRLYLHERITSTSLIIAVPPGSLPRTATKGNIRRQAVEVAYKGLLDNLYQDKKILG